LSCSRWEPSAFHDFHRVDTGAFYHDDVHRLKAMAITAGLRRHALSRRSGDSRPHGGFPAPHQPGARDTGVQPDHARRAGNVGDIGYFTSATIGVEGRALISYYDFSNGDLKVAHCSNVACGTATVTTLDSTGDIGRYAPVTIGAGGLGLISYFDNLLGDLKVAHCSNTFCLPNHRRR
jgi:hypothetical protein